MSSKIKNKFFYKVRRFKQKLGYYRVLPYFLRDFLPRAGFIVLGFIGYFIQKFKLDWFRINYLWFEYLIFKSMRDFDKFHLHLYQIRKLEKDIGLKRRFFNPTPRDLKFTGIIGEEPLWVYTYFEVQGWLHYWMLLGWRNKRKAVYLIPTLGIDDFEEYTVHEYTWRIYKKKFWSPIRYEDPRYGFDRGVFEQQSLKVRFIRSLYAINRRYGATDSFTYTSDFDFSVGSREPRRIFLRGGNLSFEHFLYMTNWVGSVKSWKLHYRLLYPKSSYGPSLPRDYVARHPIFVRHQELWRRFYRFIMNSYANFYTPKRYRPRVLVESNYDYFGFIKEKAIRFRIYVMPFRVTFWWEWFDNKYLMFKPFILNKIFAKVELTEEFKLAFYESREKAWVSYSSSHGLYWYYFLGWYKTIFKWTLLSDAEENGVQKRIMDGLNLFEKMEVEAWRRNNRRRKFIRTIRIFFYPAGKNRDRIYNFIKIRNNRVAKIISSINFWINEPVKIGIELYYRLVISLDHIRRLDWWFIGLTTKSRVPFMIQEGVTTYTTRPYLLSMVFHLGTAALYQLLFVSFFFVVMDVFVYIPPYPEWAPPMPLKFIRVVMFLILWFIFLLNFSLATVLERGQLIFYGRPSYFRKRHLKWRSIESYDIFFTYIFVSFPGLNPFVETRTGSKAASKRDIYHYDREMWWVDRTRQDELEEEEAEAIESGLSGLPQGTLGAYELQWLRYPKTFDPYIFDKFYTEEYVEYMSDEEYTEAYQKKCNFVHAAEEAIENDFEDGSYDHNRVFMVSEMQSWTVQDLLIVYFFYVGYEFTIADPNFIKSAIMYAEAWTAWLDVYLETFLVYLGVYEIGLISFEYWSSVRASSSLMQSVMSEFSYSLPKIDRHIISCGYDVYSTRLPLGEWWLDATNSWQIEKSRRWSLLPAFGWYTSNGYNLGTMEWIYSVPSAPYSLKYLPMAEDSQGRIASNLPWPELASLEWDFPLPEDYWYFHPETEPEALEPFKFFNIHISDPTDTILQILEEKKNERERRKTLSDQLDTTLDPTLYVQVFYPKGYADSSNNFFADLFLFKQRLIIFFSYYWFIYFGWIGDRLGYLNTARMYYFQYWFITGAAESLLRACNFWNLFCKIEHVDLASFWSSEYFGLNNFLFGFDKLKVENIRYQEYPCTLAYSIGDYDSYYNSMASKYFNIRREYVLHKVINSICISELRLYGLPCLSIFFEQVLKNTSGLEISLGCLSQNSSCYLSIWADTAYLPFKSYEDSTKVIASNLINYPKSIYKNYSFLELDNDVIRGLEEHTWEDLRSWRAYSFEYRHFRNWWVSSEAEVSGSFVDFNPKLKKYVRYYRAAEYAKSIFPNKKFN